MRLLHTSSVQLKEFIANPPPYAILSHTWAEEEVLFVDLQGDPTMKTGWAKVTRACRVAKDLGYQWIWIDTCCIDKSSSAELSEAINSMFRWYEESEICLAYLADVHLDSRQFIDDLNGSRWFTRGWTLQELLAPRNLCFYSSSWSRIGPRSSLLQEISLTTGIDTKYLESRKSDTKNPIFLASVAERMSWVSLRETTRVEDIAYCLLGIFQVNISLIYGEGNNAFKRLQEAILQNVNDHSIFAWGALGKISTPPLRSRSIAWWRGGVRGSLLAKHPRDFEESGDIVSYRTPQIKTRIRVDHDGVTIDSPVLKTIPDLGPQDRHGLLTPLLCCQKDDPLNCIALAHTGELGQKSTNNECSSPVICDRLRVILCSVPKRTWVPERLTPVFLPYQQCITIEQGLSTEQKCIIRTLPRSYQVKQWLHSGKFSSPGTDLEKAVPIRMPPHLVIPRRALCEKKAVEKLVSIRIGTPFSRDLVLVVQIIVFDWTDLQERSSHRADPTYLVHCLASTHGSMFWTDVGRHVGTDIKQAAQLINPNEIEKSNDVAIDVANVLQPGGLKRSEYTLRTDFRVSVSRDPFIDPAAFIIDIEDPDGLNKSYEANIRNFMPVASIASGNSELISTTTT